MADNQISTRELERFASEIADQLSKLRSSAYLDKETRRHQKNLETLLKSTKKIIENQATSDDLSNFDDLVNTAELSYRLMKRKAASDEKFQEQYVQAFGKFNKQTSLSRDIFEKISISMNAIKNSVGVLRDTSREDIEDTALNFLTGPFGKMIRDSVDMDSIKDYVSKFTSKLHRDREPMIDGQAHAGMTRIPREGTYMLDGGERVLSPQQNEDLTSFLNNVKAANSGDYNKSNEPLKVFNVGAERDYFGSILSHDAELHSETVSRETKWHRELIDRLFRLGETFKQTSKSSIYSAIMRMEIWWKRFNRHPILSTLSGIGTVLGKIGGFFTTGLREYLSDVFGIWFGRKAKSDTDRIVKAVNSVTKAIRGETDFSEKGRISNFIARVASYNLTGPNRGVSNVELAQRAEEKRARGERLTREEEKLWFRYRRNIHMINRPNNLTAALGDNNTKIMIQTNNLLADGLVLLQKWYRDWERHGKGGGGGSITKLSGLLAPVALMAPLLTKAFGMLIPIVSRVVGVFSAIMKSPLARLLGGPVAGIMTAWQIGSMINNKLQGTAAGDAIGSWVAKALAFGEKHIPGVKLLTGGSASEAVENMRRYEELNSQTTKPTATPDVSSKIRRDTQESVLRRPAISANDEPRTVKSFIKQPYDSYANIDPFAFRYNQEVRQPMLEPAKRPAGVDTTRISQEANQILREIKDGIKNIPQNTQIINEIKPDVKDLNLYTQMRGLF